MFIERYIIKKGLELIILWNYPFSIHLEDVRMQCVLECPVVRAGFQVEHREVLLRDRPKHMMKISPKGTVPGFI